MAAGQEVHAGLARLVEVALGGLAGQERVVARGDRVGEVALSAAGDDRDRAHRLTIAMDGQRLAPDQLAQPPYELGRRQAAVGPARIYPDALGERPGDVRAEPRGQQRVVAVLGMTVQRQVVGGQAHVGVEQQLQAPARGAVETPGRALPEQPVVHEHQIGVLRGRTFEELGSGAHARGDHLDFGPTGHLEPVGPVILEIPGLQDIVEIADEGFELGHASPHF